MSTKKNRELYQNLNAYIFYSKEVPKERTLALRLYVTKRILGCTEILIDMENCIERRCCPGLCFSINLKSWLLLSLVLRNYIYII